MTGVTVGGSAGGGSAQFVVFVQSTDDQQARGGAHPGRRDRQGRGVHGLRHVHEQGRQDVRRGARRRAARLEQRDGAAPGDRRARRHGRPARGLDRPTRTRSRPCRRTTSRSATSTAAQLATLAQLATSQASSRGVQAGGVSPQSLNSLTSQLKGVRSIALSLTPEDQGLRFRVGRAAREATRRRA